MLHLAGKASIRRRPVNSALGARTMQFETTQCKYHSAATLSSPLLDHRRGHGALPFRGPTLFDAVHVMTPRLGSSI